jgi:pimeloyl-ACP methyl ester carboxylesterase
MRIADTAYPLPTKKLALAGGEQVVYTEAGSGPFLVFIHGLGSCLMAWERNLAEMQTYYRCLALDLPGYGQSCKGEITPGMGYYADCISQFLAGLGIEKCILVGHSMGGQIALTTALNYPDLVEKLVLAAPAGLEEFSPEEAHLITAAFSPERLLNASAQQIEDSIRLNFHHYTPEAAQFARRRLQYTQCHDYPTFCRVLSASVNAMLREPVKARLSELAVSTLLVFGKEDAYIPNTALHPNLTVATLLETTHQYLPTITNYLLPQAGHFVQWEQAREFNKLIKAFCSDQVCRW